MNKAALSEGMPSPEENENTDVAHDALDWLRDNAPVYRDEESGSWVLTRHNDIRSYLSQQHSKDPDNAEPGTFLETAGKPINPHRPNDPCGMGYLDNPDHHRVRAPFMRALRDRILKSTDHIQNLVDERLEQLSQSPEFDIVADYAIPIPMKAIAHLIGLPDQDLPQFREWAVAGFKSFDPQRTPEESKAVDDAQEGFAKYLEQAIADRRKTPKDDLISDMILAQSEGADISDGEIRVNCMSVSMAAMMSTTDLIGTGIWLFLRHPSELKKLKTNPNLIKAAVEEILRLESPVKFEWRIAADDLEIRGCPIAKGQVVNVSLIGGNHDPETFANPREFNITRPSQPHLAFGSGEHVCIGAALGRLEGQIAIQSFFNRFPDAQLADPTSPPKWRDLPFFHGLATLIVRQ